MRPEDAGMTPVTVSVIVPTHNRPGFLVGAIASVLRQTFTDYEIIVVDDGSTDDTREVVERIASPKVRYVYQENAGVGAARNRGIALARGRYIAFVDDDDEILPDTLAAGVEILEKHPEYAMTYGELGFIDPRGNPAKGYATIGVKTGYLFKDFVLRSINPPILTWLVRRSVFEEIGGFDSRFVKSEDYDMILRITGGYKLYGIPASSGSPACTTTTASGATSAPGRAWCSTAMRTPTASMPFSPPTPATTRGSSGGAPSLSGTIMQPST